MAKLTNEDEDQDDTTTTTSTEEHVEVENDEKPVVKPDVEVIEDDGKGGEDDRITDTDEDEDDKPAERRRETAAERRQRAKLAKERDKRELNFQRSELARQDKLIADLQRGQVVTRVSDLDSRIATSLNEVQTFEQIRAKALEAKNGTDFNTADRLRNEAAAKANELINEKNRLVAEANKPVVKPLPYLDKAQKFMRDNPWYNANGQDADSQLVREIDTAVSKEYVPTSEKYWEELQKRVKKHLPEKFGEVDDQEDTQEDAPVVRRKGPPVGGSNRSNSSTVTQIRLSPERVAAMKEAGIWEDPVQRAKMAKTYANYDKNNSRG